MAVDGKDTRILVVDDEPSVREFVERALRHYGYDVTSAADGNAAIAALSDGTVFDMLLTDIVMPDLDGVALALKVANDWPDTKIVMMSGYTQQRQRAHNLEELVEAIISKPFSIEDLCEQIDDVLSGKSKNPA